MKKIFTRLFVLFLLSFVTTSAWAQLTEFEEGAVYRFVNRSTGRALNAGESSDGTLYVNATTVAADDLKQQWYVTKSGDYYVLRNLYYAKYLKGAITNKVPWSLTDYDSASSNLFSLVISATSYNTLETKDWTNYGFMHDDGNGYNGGYRVVSWNNGDGSNSSHWTIHKVEYTAEALKEVLEAHPTTEEVLTKRTDNFVSLFNEGACYTPKYSTLDEAKATAEYLALEDEIRELADKIYNKALTTDGWAEDNADAEKAAAGLNWDAEYAKKFRVQMYEPYSIAGDITAFLRMNAHANNDNPTGIYVPEGGVVYVMVEGEIKDGATLRLIDAGSNERITDATTGGYELNTGLNIIRYAEEAGMLYICYNVDTYDPNGESEDDKFPHKLSEYPPLKIHIEGGAINGFYSSCGDYLANKTYEGVTYNEDLWGGVDDDNDGIYMEVRANLSVLPIISHRQILLFQLNEENGQQGMKHFLPESVSVPDTPFSYPQNGETSSWDDYDAYGMDCNITTGKINIWMETWDRIMHAELATLGLISEDDVNKMNEFYPRWKSDGTKAEIYDMTNAGPDGKTYKMFCNGRDYSEYYNHHGVSLGTTSGYMSAGWNAANYNNSTFGELMGMPTSGGLWGPVHEVGHQFQDVFNIRGATEVTNNVFSNAATWYQGISTSRYNGGNLTTTLDNFNSGLPFVDYNIWSMTQMFYKLWLYYHLAGNNTQFYPRFFEMLRVDPLNAKNATATGTESMLKIYEKMCDASGEDLTEFFRAHGFFVLLDNYAKEDYGITVFTQTQEEVDAAIERVKSKGYKENLAVILINDGAEATLRHDGKTPRSFFDGTENPEYGGVNDFIDGSATAGGAYTATVNSDGTMTMIGEGGIGFLVFDENGNIISFNDNSTFALSDEAKEAILTGNATIVSVGSDINAEPVVAEIDLTAMQKAILGELIAKAQPIIDKIDNTYTKIGFYKGAAVADLAEVLAYAKEVYAASSGYEAAYDLLYAELKKVEANGDAKIPFNSSLTYIITNKAYPGETMWVRADSTVRSESGVDVSLNSAKWQFKETGVQGVYNIYNMSGLYCPAVETSTAMKAVNTEQPDTLDALYTLQEMEDGVWAIKLSPAASYRNFHSSWSNVVGWETGNDASRWYLTAVEAEPAIADLTDLEVYITKTETLLNEVLGDVTYTQGENITLQTTTEGSAGYVWSNAPCATEGNIASLVDGATNNYFHTEWNGDAVTSGAHYIAVDLGEDNTLSRFSFSHTTRSGATNDFPKSVDIYGSDDNVTYKYLGSASGMPQTAGTFWQYEGMMVASHRYLRFNVHANRGYWHLAEFDIMPVESFSATVNDTFSGTVTVDAVTAAMEALMNGKGVAFSMSPTKETIDPVLKALETAYKALYKEYEATITARKNTLAQLVTETNELIDQVGSVTIVATNEVALQTADPNGDFYVSTNALSSQEGSIAYLVDGVISQESYFHTDYSGANSSDGLDHYINISLGNSNATNKFKFSYANRTNAAANFASAMEIYGSTDGTNYELITGITGDLPASANSKYNSDVIECAKDYTYLRFMVTANSSNNEKGGHPFFHMAEFDLTTVGYTTVDINGEYSGVVSEDLLLSSVLVTNSSDSVSKNPLVTSVPLLDAQIADQQAVYDKLNEAIQKLACDKSALEELINATEALKSRLYKHTYTQGSALALQADNAEQANYLYCNASESNSEYGTDNKGVAALLDSDETNYLHTEWNGDQSADGLDHYLRVDLGEDGKFSDFVFSYKSTRDLPRTFVVEGCNTADGVYERIGLYVGANSTNTPITSCLMGNGKAYRYLRFRVTQTHSGKKDNSGYHYYFVLSDFDVYPVNITGVSAELKDEYANTIYKYNTASLVTEVVDAVSSATTVKDDESASQETVNDAVEALQAIYDKLDEALKYAGLPVTITTDEENPVLYRIISKRADDGSKVLQFDEPTSDKVAIVDKTDNASYQAWYFMQGENGYLIKPFNGCGKVLSVESTSDGEAKANITEAGENLYYEWNFTKSNVDNCTDYFYIYADGTGYACLSHNGGFDATDKLGIWASGWNSNDGGSLFKFIDAEFENDNARFYQLSDFEKNLEYRTADTPEGEMVGAFDNGAAYSEAYTTASTLITAGNTSDATACRDAYTALRIVSDNLEENVIEEGKYYRIDITPGLTDGRAGASMCIDDNGKLAWGEFVDADARFYFTFEYDSDDNLYMKNLHTATYLDEALGNSTNIQVGADAETITDAGSNVVAKSVAINTLGTSGDAVVVAITPNGGAMLNCKLEEKIIVAYDNTAVDKASAWVITEVADITPIKHNVTMNATFSSVTLGYNATVPAGVEAYNAEGLEGGYVTLVKVAGEGEVIPENTPVILYRTDDEKTKTFTYTDATAEKPASTLLGGSLYTKYVVCDDSDYYKLMIKSGEAKMYLMYKEFNAQGVSQGPTHDGGHIKCSANKIYMRVPAARGIASYGMRFVDYGTTDIDDVKGESGDVKTIYDLQGRKLTEITEPGFYIVDGKRVYVK